MRYMGSKAKIAKDILPIMLKDIGDKTFVDLFTGGGNLFQFVNAKNIIANDINPYTIAFLQRLKRDGVNWLPKNNKELTEADYKYIRNHQARFLNSFLGHVGYNLSFGGKWFGGWCRDKNSKGEWRDYVDEQYRASVKLFNNLKDKNIQFVNKSYDQVEIPPNSIIYCDIPYKNTTQYNAVDKFDYDKFYDWCIKMKLKGHIVYISEYSMPEDFICVWQKEVNECLNVVHNTECEFSRKQSLILFVSDELDSIKKDLINMLQSSENFILKQDSNIPNVFGYSYKIGDVEYSILLILCKPTEVKSYLSGTHLYDMTLLDNYTQDKSWVEQAKGIACCDKVSTVSLR